METDSFGDLPLGVQIILAICALMCCGSGSASLIIVAGDWAGLW